MHSKVMVSIVIIIIIIITYHFKRWRNLRWQRMVGTILGQIRAVLGLNYKDTDGKSTPRVTRDYVLHGNMSTI